MHGCERRAAAAGSVALGIWRLARGERLRDAAGHMVDRPERVAGEPTATQRIVA